MTYIIKVIISLCSLTIAYLIYTQRIKKIDDTLILLIFFGIIPWISSFINSIELPSGFKIELNKNDIDASFKKAEIITSNSSNNNIRNIEIAKPNYLTIINTDANLALIGLRLEIEKKIKILASTYEIPITGDLLEITNELENKGIFNKVTITGLLEIVELGNEVAHGKKINFNAKDLIINKGIRIISELDRLNSLKFEPNIDEKIAKANLILTFEGEGSDKLIKMAIEILSFTIKNYHIRLTSDSSLKMKTGDLLNRLGALIEIDKNERGIWSKHKITPLGIALYTFLVNQYDGDEKYEKDEK